MMRKLLAVMAAIPVLLLGLALPASAAAPVSQAATSCGVWRWPAPDQPDFYVADLGKRALALCRG